MRRWRNRPIERGDYLVNTIMACGNCHTPRDADGRTDRGQGAVRRADLHYAGIRRHRIEHHARPRDRNRELERCRDQARAGRGGAARSRPSAGVPLAAIMPANFYKALLPEDLDAIVAYLRSVKPVRNEIADPVYKAPVHRDPYPDAESGFNKSMFTDPVRRGAYLVTIGHCMECHSAWSRGVSDFKTGLGRGGRSFADAEGPGGSDAPPISPRTPPPASAPGPTRKSSARSPKALPATDGCSSRRWAIAFTRG